MPPTYKDILTPAQQLVHEAALQACREEVAAKQAHKKAGSERVPEIYKELVSDDTDSEDWDPECDDPKEGDRHHRPPALRAANVPLTIIDNEMTARHIISICGISMPPTYKDILTPAQQLVHEAALQACREEVAAKQARKKAGSERVPEIYKELMIDDTDSEDWDTGGDDPKEGAGAWMSRGCLAPVARRVNGIVRAPQT